jgi:spore coat polysaccharide biosynthesis predicted glycosyltransferase SpsG
MIALMQNSDIAIASGGQTLYEMVLVGIPTLSILLVDNAKDDTICWDSVEANIYVSEWNDEDILNKLQYNIDKIQDIKLREYLQQNGWKHLKSNGAKKLVKEIVDDII